MEDALLPRDAGASLRALFLRWDAARSPSSLPGLNDMDVEAVFADSPGAALFAVERGRARRVCYRFERVGPEFQAAVGRDLTGAVLSDILPRAVVRKVGGVYDRIVADGHPHYWQRTVTTWDGALQTYERLLVPLAGDGSLVDRLLGIWRWVECDGSDHPRERLPLAFAS